jgi:hypothetical protein
VPHLLTYHRNRIYTNPARNVHVLLTGTSRTSDMDYIPNLIYQGFPAGLLVYCCYPVLYRLGSAGLYKS